MKTLLSWCLVVCCLMIPLALAAEGTPKMVRGVVDVPDQFLPFVEVSLVTPHGSIVPSSGKLGVQRYFEFAMAKQAAASTAIRLSTASLPKGTIVDKEKSVLEVPLPNTVEKANVEGLQLKLVATLPPAQQSSGTAAKNNESSSSVSWANSLVTLVLVGIFLYFHEHVIDVVESLTHGGPRKIMMAPQVKVKHR